MRVFSEDEEKRSRLWRIVTTLASVLIVVVAVYFISKGFFGNPLKGSWQYDDGQMTLEIRGNQKAELTWEDPFPDRTLKVDLEYSLNTRQKQITFRADREELARAAGELGADVTEQEVETAMDLMLTSFNYSLDGQELTLKEWDFGDQLVFTAKR